MTEIVVQGTLRPDGILELSQPINLPPGQVRVVVQSPTPQFPSTKDTLAVLEGIWAERRSMGLKGRSKKQIDADIQAKRDEWDDRPCETRPRQAVSPETM